MFLFIFTLGMDSCVCGIECKRKMKKVARQPAVARGLMESTDLYTFKSRCSHCGLGMEVFSEEGWERGKEMASLGLESLTFWPPSFPYIPFPPHIWRFPHFPYVPYLSWQTDLSMELNLPDDSYPQDGCCWNVFFSWDFLLT